MKWECQKSYFLFLNLTFSGQAYSLRRYAFHNPGIVHNKNSAFHRFQCSSRERKRSFIHIMYFAFLLNCYFYVYLSPCPRDAGVIWRRRFRSENPSNVFDHNTHEEIETERNNNHSYHDVIVFEKSAFSKCFPSQQKQKPSVFKFLRFEEPFRRAPFLWRMSVDDRPNQRNKATFSNSSGLVWTGSNRFLPFVKCCSAKAAGCCWIFFM